MKQDRNRVEGQVDIFEAMNRAAAAVDKMVEDGKQESRKKSLDKKLKSGKDDKEPYAGSLKKQDMKKSADCIRSSEMHAAMRKTFLNPEDGDFAMIAYIDYHMVYVRDWNAPATLRKFDNSKDAVEYYMEQLERIREQEGVEPASEHEPFVDVRYVSENQYMECD